MIQRVVKFTLLSGLSILVISLAPEFMFTPEFPMDPVVFQVPTSDPKFVFNNVLNQSERLHENLILGPESLAQSGDFIYSGLGDGRIMRFNLRTGDTKDLGRLTRDVATCETNVDHQVLRCGRPLGLRIDHSDRTSLLIADALFGLNRMNLTTGEFEKLVNIPDVYNGLLDDLVQDPVEPSILYVTIATRKWAMDRALWSLMEHESSGVLLGVNLKTKSVVLLKDNLFFPNGVETSSDKRSLLISETGASIITKVSLEESRAFVMNKGNEPEPRKLVLFKQVFVSGIPGSSDNIRMFKGNLYVAIPLGRSAVMDHLSSLPTIRRAIGRVFHLSSQLVGYVNHYLPIPMLEQIHFKLRSGLLLHSSLPSSTGILIVDGKTGEYKGLMGSNTFSSISEVLVEEETSDIYFGSFVNKFIGRIKAKDVVF